MNTPVSFELAQLLKEKQFNKPCRSVYDNWGHIEDWYDMDKEYHRNSEKNTSVYYSAPTIADVVMWLYEKHGLWIVSIPTVTGFFTYKVVDVQMNPEKIIERPPYGEVCAYDYNSPTEAYEAAIEYTLNNLI